MANNYRNINLTINGDKRAATGWYDQALQQYHTLVPGKNVTDRSGTGEPNVSVQGHEAVYDKDGNLVRVGALGYSSESGFYPTQWPSKTDSIYNANAAKAYADQVFQQIPKQEDGGNMNYFQYLQTGGVTEDQTQQIVAQVIAALKQDPEATIKKLKEMGEQGKQLFEIAIQSDPELQEMFSQSMKCGGKVRAKVKKAKCGKKLQEGDKIKKVSTRCTCQLKRVGGRIIEVDSCTGMPIHRNGGIMKFQSGGWFKNPFSSLEAFQWQFGAPIDALVRGTKKVYQWMQNDPNNPENRKVVQPQASQESAPKVLTQDEVTTQREESRQGVEALQEQSQKKQSNPPQKETFIQWIKKNINKPGGEDWSSYNNRVMLANKYGIKNYKGTAQQNMLLWDRLKHEVNAGVNPTAVQPQRIAAPTMSIAVPRIGITIN